MKETKFFKLCNFKVKVYQESILRLDDGKIIIFDNILNFDAEIPTLEETDQIFDYDMDFSFVHRHGNEICMCDKESRFYQISAFIIEPRKVKSILLKTPHFENHLNIIMNDEETSIYSLISEHLSHCKLNLNIEASSTHDKLNIYSQSEEFINKLESLILLRQIISKEEKDASKFIIKNCKRL